MEQADRIYRQCYMIRCFEQRVEEEFARGTMRGTTHGCTGQEIIPVLVLAGINHENDYVTGTHRCHGQVLSYTDDPYSLACEMMGKEDGFLCGMGGSQHIRTGKYLTNGITGGMAVTAAGIAMGIKKSGQPGIVISFLGDGGFNEGYVQESLNLASVFGLPVFYVCENNRYAMSTLTQSYSAGSFRQRVGSLDIRYMEADTSEIEDLWKKIKECYAYTVFEKKPCFLDIHTARLCGHSKSDKMDYMTEEEKKENRRKDPLRQLEKLLGRDEKLKIEKETEKKVEEAFERAHRCREKQMED